MDVAAIRFDNAMEGVICRGEDDDMVARFADRLQDEAERGDDARRVADPARIDLHAVAALQPPGACLPPGFVGVAISIDAVLDSAMQRFLDRKRRLEIHVGDPHRNGVGRIEAYRLAHSVPFVAAGVAAVDDAVEIDRH